MVAGALQTCAGQNAGAEVAVHAMKNLFEKEDTEAVLLVDTNNAFNRINRQAAHQYSLSIIQHNTYGMPIRLFITGEGELSSTEGTTQGDPLAMAMYTLAVTPLIRDLCHRQPDISQVWYADI